MKKFKIGLQLYSVKEDMKNDIEGTLRSIAEMGYECVEFAGYFGHTAEEIKAICDKYNLEIPSVHQTHDVFLDTPGEAIEYIKTLGVKYCTIPWVSKDSWENNYDTLLSEFRKVSSLLKDNGIQLLYHNHEYEFQVLHNDKFILDSIFDDLGYDVMRPELDTCWVSYSANDPVAYINKFRDAQEVLHLKDFECEKYAAGPAYALIDSAGNAASGDRQSNGFTFKPVGYGFQDIKAIMEAAENTSIEYIIVEQDGHPEHTALEDAKISIDYLRSIGY